MLETLTVENGRDRADTLTAEINRIGL